MVFVLFNLANRLIGKDSNRCLVQMSMKCTPERFFLLGNVRNLANALKAGYSELCKRKLVFCIICGTWGNVLIRTVRKVSECCGWVFVMGGPSQNLCVLWK